MNGFLLIVRMSMDDIPIRLFATNDSMAHWLQYSNTSFEKDVDAIARKFGWPVSTLLSVDAIEFRDGQPHEVWHVMNLEVA